MTSYSTSQFASWKARSDEYVALAMNVAQPRRTRIDGSFEAAYFAFITVLARRDRLPKTEDHPNTYLANAAGVELRLSRADRELAMKLTRAYYAGNRDKFDPDVALAWAKRVREAVWGKSDSE